MDAHTELAYPKPAVISTQVQRSDGTVYIASTIPTVGYLKSPFLRYRAYVRPAPLLLAALSLACHLRAQSTLADLQARLIKQPLYLRGQWRDDKLSFDASGQLIGTSASTTFTIAGFEIRSVELKGDRLVLKGKRAGLEFKHDQPKRVVIDKEAIQMEIMAPSGGDYTLPLDRILTPSFTDLLQPVPSYWRSFAQQHLLSPAVSQSIGGSDSADPTATSRSSVDQSASPSKALVPSSAKVFKPGGSVTAPRLVGQVDPHYSAQATSLQYSADVQLQLVVDQNGDPSHLVILHPAGLELDERDLAAVAHYKFAAASENGKAIPVQLTVDVNFQTF